MGSEVMLELGRAVKRGKKRDIKKKEKGEAVVLECEEENGRGNKESPLL